MALLLGGLFGEMMGAQLESRGEGMTILFALAALGLSLLWLRRFNRRVANDQRYNAVILRIDNQPVAEKISFNIK